MNEHEVRPATRQCGMFPRRGVVELCVILVEADETSMQGERRSKAFGLVVFTLAFVDPWTMVCRGTNDSLPTGVGCICPSW
jgi:hypothetical protein